MEICQNPDCSNPFNPDGNRFCISCGERNFGKLLRNRFRVSTLLGEGGFSRTYKAEDVDRLDAPCVIKQFFPQVQGTSQLTKAALLFKEEAFRLYELGENHPSIPRLLAYFEQGSCLYLVQEFIQGHTLLKELQEKTFSEQEIWEILGDLLPVLEFIHSRNVIHRDIKPENIIRRTFPKKELVLIDFGGAKQVTQTSIGRQATAIYTIGYAPTEQMAGFAYHSSDLYSLGVTCIRLLTKCLPIQDDYGQIQDHLYDPMSGQWLWRECLQEKSLTVSKELEQILDKLLKHLPKERYQSAAEVLKDLSSSQLSSTQLLSHSQYESPTRIQKIISVFPPLQSFEFEVVTVNAAGNEIRREERSGNFYIEELGNGVTVEMVAIPGGSFMMGSSDEEGDADERPQHQVNLEPFFMGKFPITQNQWRFVANLPKIKQSLNPNPSKFRGTNRPVENVSWHEAVEFCARLSEKTGRNYRLPSEAEWEYACRAGTTTPFHFGETLTSDLANCSDSDIHSFASKGKSRKETTVVGSFQVANAFGLYDMHGLVWEWCADPWHKNYDGAPRDGRIWEIGGDHNRRVLRGGSWSFSSVLCRSASRSWNESDGGLRVCGFRVIAT
ncbi:bifunctional serine/threonine-protein kinase/formylglycine-generating enzyme family protein [Aetokthonos hydrillicola Thurmond2011]|jgi:formylglycine-generating enzyme required for sulfatase activity/tRNA A-37 threonylcarbamoyl transferase component Bud32|uniref:Bifunctional serine/threonine-protein kinase/formylglycine-generating enzyme family protein n=1 Tax=Aetokthonos hydrillicola Thurmond2011 TaxID=2712845 RepID=A0AAP5I8I4_9CYAN|nr:bifunctional serine/threonine-protein kinase/formylglycine-generating enzyme family protein [Aetokthonos hydrillicola]MBO3461825.1 SUMF1/EgtB/PvdO family nonheme iron enzyme [Aetokthonos hydrillicola CCALA 1050]MBW4589970.1 SUMF1/EgtB/PvdO family nonheme iron enzyme [Aetokthonos hydrillicola CCALA 1050]MDR9895704.1 bifunctional serine/threonine-protein kinase/formylglycine-generating enzyme family protein [Aetokthonos hydrillicola Thurmond2011]